MILSVEGRNIYYDLIGDKNAPTIYLAHPLAADSGVWAEQVPALLDAGFQVLRVDMRGHGGSQATAGNYSMEELVEDAVRVLDHLGIAKAHFCGVSIGGMISEGVAILHPERVISLILGNTRAAGPADAEKRWGPRIAEVRAEGTLTPLADSTMERWLSPRVKEANPSLWRQIRQTIASTPVDGYVGCARAIQAFSWTSRLHEIAAPALVVCGADDTGSDFGENEMIAGAVQRGEFLPIEGARHLPNAEDPALFNRLLIDWCTKHAQ